MSPFAIYSDMRQTLSFSEMKCSARRIALSPTVSLSAFAFETMSVFVSPQRTSFPKSEQPPSFPREQRRNRR